MRVVNVAGYQDVGKTTLVERLVPVLAEYGRVATVKSIHHDVEIDTPETDTYRHREAGAETVVGIAPSLTFEIRRRGKAEGVTVESKLTELRDRGYDFVVVEGFKEARLPSIVVGDIETDAVGGRVVSRVEAGRRADIDELVEDVRSLGEWVPTE